MNYRMNLLGYSGVRKDMWGTRILFGVQGVYSGYEEFIRGTRSLFGVRGDRPG